MRYLEKPLKGKALLHLMLRSGLVFGLFIFALRYAVFLDQVLFPGFCPDVQILFLSLKKFFFTQAESTLSLYMVIYIIAAPFFLLSNKNSILSIPIQAIPLPLAFTLAEFLYFLTSLVLPVLSASKI